MTSVTRLEDKEEILRIEDLHTYFYSVEGVVKAANGVDLSVKADSTLGHRGRERLREVGDCAIAPSPDTLPGEGSAGRPSTSRVWTSCR